MPNDPVSGELVWEAEHHRASSGEHEEAGKAKPESEIDHSQLRRESPDRRGRFSNISENISEAKWAVGLFCLPPAPGKSSLTRESFWCVDGPWLGPTNRAAFGSLGKV
jgi:hypothetical protein